MNRIYQGKVTAVEISDGRDGWEKFSDGEFALWHSTINFFRTRLIITRSHWLQWRLEFFSERVSDKERTIKHFDHLAATALRKHFSDGKLNTIFRVLNRDLLELPVGKDGGHRTT